MEAAAAAPVAAPAPSAPAPAAAPSTPSPAPSTGTEPIASQAATETPSAPAEKPAPRTYRMKVNGQEQEVPAEDFDRFAGYLGQDPQTLLKGAQLHKAAYQKFEEARKQAAEAAALRERLKANPWEAIKELGIDPDEAAQRRVWEQFERERLKAENPAELARLDAEKRTKELEAQLAEREKAEKAQHREAQLQQLRERWNKELPEVLRAAKMPQVAESFRPALARAIADELEVQHKAGMPLDTLLAAEVARERMYETNRAIIAGLANDDELVAYLGEETIKRILRHSVSKARGAPLTPPQPTLAPVPAKPRPSMLSTEEWRAKYG